jgi:hypothetical protein
MTRADPSQNAQLVIPDRGGALALETHLVQSAMADGRLIYNVIGLLSFMRDLRIPNPDE